MFTGLKERAKAYSSFKPNLLRYTKAMAGKACHGFGSTTQVGLTQGVRRHNQASMDSTLLTGIIGAIATIGAVVLGWYLHRPKTERSEEHTSELQSLMRNSSAALCLKKKTKTAYNKVHIYIR